MISTHVPSLELCKKISDLGWKKDTMFWWVELESPELRYEIHYKATWDFRLGNPTIPAPTVGEMLEVMPDMWGIYKVRSHIYQVSDDREIRADNVFVQNNHANALACALIHLLENNLVKLEG